MIRRHLPSVRFGFVAMALVLPSAANACTACMGDPSSKTAGAMNAAIFLMIGFVALMVASFGSFAWYLSKRVTTGSTVPDMGISETSGQSDPLT